MNKYLACFCAVVFFAGISSLKAQTEKIGCGTMDAWQTEIQLHPELVQQRQQLDSMVEQYIHHNMVAARTSSVDTDAVWTIPVVFHILHQGGSENISDDQVRNCIQILNTDYHRKNADTIYTVIQFRPVAADTKIQFQLATLDPNGNCTNGITRTYTHRTENFVTPYGLSITDWPSDKYLNIWVVESILTGAAFNGQVIGLGTLPPEPSGDDGVILRYDFVGNIGPAHLSLGYLNYAGRDADHEVGHYLNMIHTWGDANCGNDQVDDTPTEYGPYYGCPCGTVGGDTCYVYDDSCGSPNPPGVMYQNYMDYTDGDCKNIFTDGQKARMRAALSLYRFSLWQPSNLAATGTDSATISFNVCPTCNSDSFNNPHCPPVADFLPEDTSICMGGSIIYSAANMTTNGTPTSWKWSFPGAILADTSFDGPNPGPITYNTPGAYHAILTVSNANGSSTMDKGSCALVDWGFGLTNAPFSEGFEGSLALPGGWRVFNDDGGPAWQVTNVAAHSGSNSISIQNFETLNSAGPNYTAPGSVKELRSPAISFTYVSASNTPMLTFYLAYGQQYSANTDSLSVDVSTNCGASWHELMHLAGSALAAGSGGVQQGAFVPADASQWAFVSTPLYNLPGITLTKNKNVKFRFYFTTGLLSNNLYIDDINITTTGTLDVPEEQNMWFEFNVYPNPANQSFTANYILKHAEDLTINLYDIQGRLIRQIENNHQSPGTYDVRIDGNSFNLASGVYVLKMITSDGVISKKLIYSKD